MEPKFITTDLSTNKQRSNDLFHEFLHSAAYSATQAPVNGFVERIDKVCGTDFLAHVSFIDHPKEQQAFSSSWHAQQFGSIPKTTLPFPTTETEASLLIDIARNPGETDRQMVYRDFLLDGGRSGEAAVWSTAIALPKSITLDAAIVEAANALNSAKKKK